MAEYQKVDMRLLHIKYDGELHFRPFSPTTYLDSLIGNFDSGYSTEWKFSNFLAALILREINFGSFQKVKNCSLNNFKGIEY